MDTSFKLVKSVLDDLYKLISVKHGENATKVIKDRLRTLSGEYTTLTSPIRIPIDYADPVTRFAYVFTYVAAHSSYVKQRLLSCEQLKSALSRNDGLKVTCVGGGPGSEMLGLLQACMSLDREKPLTVWLLDREESWSETWAEIDTRLEATFKLSTNSRQSDVTSYKTFDNLQKAFSSDIFIMSFFMSEIYAFRTDATPFLSRMTSDMPAGAMVLYIDNSADDFTNYAESVFKAKSFELLHSETKEKLFPSNSEQTSDLEPYKSQFERTPKVTSHASVRIWRKK
jgi:Putative SAM-dependent methyltransferase